MVDKIYDIKNKVIERIEKDMSSRGIDRIDVVEFSKLVDMVKDLAEAEEKCWEAQYYRTVTGAMDGKSGYGQGAGTGSSAGYGMQGGARSGYAQDTARQGYGQGSGYGMSGHQEVKDLVRKMQMADPAEKEHIIQELRTQIGM